MNSDNRNPALLRNEARSVAVSSTEPFVAWSELKRWSLGKGPAAAKAAAVSFMEEHGRKPEAAAIMPEIARMAMRMPEPERNELLELANRPFSPPVGFQRSVSPISSAIGAMFSKKKEQKKEPPAPPPDIVRMMEQRDAIFHVNRGVLGMPREGKKAEFAPALPLSRRDFTPLSAGHGHALVQSLAEKLSVHGHEGHIHAENPGECAFALAKKRSAVKAKAATSPPARKRAQPARKKARSRAPANRSVRATKKKARR